MGVALIRAKRPVVTRSIGRTAPPRFRDRLEPTPPSLLSRVHWDEPLVNPIDSAAAQLTFTTTVAVGSTLKFGIVVFTLVIPTATGSNSTPPEAAPNGDWLWPTGITTVTDPPVVAVVTSCPAATLLDVTVAVTPGDPGRTA